MSSTFKFAGDAKLKHLNIRKEGDEEKILKVDMKVDADCGMAVVDYLDTGLRGFLWSTEGIVRNPLVKDIGYTGEVGDCTAEVQGLNFSGVRVHKFVVAPKDSWRATILMTLTFEPSSTDVAVLAENVGESISIDLQSAPSLLDDAVAAGEGLSELCRADGITATISDAAGTVLVTIDGSSADPMLEQAAKLISEHKRASISLVQRHLRIGYNRAARLLESLEASGHISPMASNGQRTVLNPA